MNNDKIELQILDDGTIIVTTDGVSGSNHVSADALVKFLAQQMGGAVSKTKRPQKIAHNHQTARQ